MCKRVLTASNEKKNTIIFSLFFCKTQNWQLIDAGSTAINEAITNAEDKLESNKAVKIISTPKDIFV